MFRIRMIVILKVKVNVNVKFSSLVFCQSCCVVINTDHILCVGTCTWPLSVIKCGKKDLSPLPSSAEHVLRTRFRIARKTCINLTSNDRQLPTLSL